MVRGVADAVVLSAEEQEFLESQVRRHKAPRSLSDRCRIVLSCAQGLTSKEVARKLGVNGLSAAAHAARKGADATAGMTRAKAGRAAYVPAQNLSGHADSGAEAVARLFEELSL